ncbi:T3SC_I_like domain containing protein [Oxalobacteraceae bacterium]
MNISSEAIATVGRWLSTRVPEARFDEDGVAALVRDEETMVVIEVDQGGTTCHLYAPVCRAPDHAPELTLIAALELNRFGRPLGGCWLAWDPDLSMFSLCYNLRIPDNDAQTFSNTLDHFIASIDRARGYLNPDTSARADRAIVSAAQLA